MIEAEWWEYDSAEEMADAVAGDVAFIIESALDARGSSGSRSRSSRRTSGSCRWTMSAATSAALPRPFCLRARA
jgi:hypothetical protein